MDMRLTTLIDEKQIQNRIQEMAKEITAKYKGKDLTAICVLKGSFMFYADLIRAIDLDVNCEFYGLSSYHGRESTGEVRVTLDIMTPLHGKNILIVEDIVDTGLTMEYMRRNLESRGPQSISTATLLFKPDALKKPVELDYVGFKIPNQFVVGYGLDYEGWYRNIPYIATVDNFN